MSKENQSSNDSTKKFFWVVAAFVLIVLVGYNLYSGITVEKIGVPGVFMLEFGKKPYSDPGLVSQKKDSVDPKVIATSPQNGEQNVDPSLMEISVTFDMPMQDNSWSWSSEDKNKFPKMRGEPYYAENYTKCVLPVKLEPQKDYVIWINSANYRNFRSKTGIPVEPYKLTFRTK